MKLLEADLSALNRPTLTDTRKRGESASNVTWSTL